MKNIIKVLHFDDEVYEIEKLRSSLKNQDLGYSFEIDSCCNEADINNLIHHPSPDIAILDIHTKTNHIAGLNIINTIKSYFPDCIIIMRSNLDNAKIILDSFAAGADDFISKNSDNCELCLRVINSYELCKIKKGIPTKSASRNQPDQKIIGSTMKKVDLRIPRIMQSAITSIFISGESGCGKEVVASLFKKNMIENTPFISVNCGAIAPTLLESELFGHVKGAFTGAIYDRVGIIESANNGWVFLDEVACLSLNAQVALLRILENSELIRVGSSTPRNINVRFLSATNENIESLIGSGKFRKDLWQRLNEARINLPPLSDRKDEIPEFIDFFATVMKGGPYIVLKPTLEILSTYNWQEGNVRELRNCLRAMTEYQMDKQLPPAAIPKEILKKIEIQSKKEPFDSIESNIDTHLSIQIDTKSPPSLAELSDLLLIEVLYLIIKNDQTTSMRKLSSLLNISRTTLRNRIKSILDKNQIENNKIDVMKQLFKLV
ncbi:MAG: sigma 54-interacting transcriptional regulator [Bdellovibrionota bacterium]